MKELLEVLGSVSGTRLVGYTFCIGCILFAIGQAINLAASGFRKKS